MRRGGERTVDVDYPHFFPEAPFARLALRGKVLRGFQLLPPTQLGDFAGGEWRLRRWAVCRDGECGGGSRRGGVQVQALEGARRGRKANPGGRQAGDEEARHCGSIVCCGFGRGGTGGTGGGAIFWVRTPRRRG